MKRITIILGILLSFVFLSGCLDYKSTAAPSTEILADEEGLLKEIAQIEAELEAEEQEVKKVEEEVKLPGLGNTSVKEAVNEEEMEVIRVKENEYLSLKPKINDPDGDPITFSFSLPLNEQGEWKTNYGDAGEYTASLSATDSVLTTTKRIKIIVERVNVAPVIDNVKDLVVSEGEVVSFQPSVTDPNGDPISVTVSEPLKNGLFQTDHTSAGEYTLKVVASDGELETEKTFTLIVKEVNSLPKISPLENIFVREGETVYIKPEVSDLDQDEIVVTISEPVGNDGVWETGFTDKGEYSITITASDGKDTVTKIVQVTIEDVNVAPEIVDIIVEKN